MKKGFQILCVALLLFANNYAQEIDITGALKSIEAGKIYEAEAILKRLQSINSSYPDVIFLDAILTKSGDESLKKYSSIFEKYPKSKYADVSLFRVFSYYYSLGLYKKAENYYKRLKIDYPSSPYIASADRKIPNLEESQNSSISVSSDSTAQLNSENSPIYKYTIQAGAFLSVENAMRLKEQLNQDGYISEIINRVVGGSLLKVVTSGKFATEEEAKLALTQIENNYKLKGRVIPISPKP